MITRIIVRNQFLSVKQTIHIALTTHQGNKRQSSKNYYDSFFLISY